MKSLALLPGHGNKPGGWDPGAVSPRGWTEADFVRQVAGIAWSYLQEWRIPVTLVAGGSYGQRGQQAEAGVGCDLVVQLHADAVPGPVGPDVGTIYYYPDNEDGDRAARVVARALNELKLWPFDARPADETAARARGCLGAVRSTSILIELGYTDGARGAVELPGRRGALGLALATGLRAWWGGAVA